MRYNLIPILKIRKNYLLKSLACSMMQPKFQFRLVSKDHSLFSHTTFQCSPESIALWTRSSMIWLHFIFPSSFTALLFIPTLFQPNQATCYFPKPCCILLPSFMLFAGWCVLSMLRPNSMATSSTKLYLLSRISHADTLEHEPRVLSLFWIPTTHTVACIIVM